MLIMLSCSAIVPLEGDYETPGAPIPMMAVLEEKIDRLTNGQML